MDLWTYESEGTFFDFKGTFYVFKGTAKVQHLKVQQ